MIPIDLTALGLFKSEQSLTKSRKWVAIVSQHILGQLFFLLLLPLWPGADQDWQYFQKIGDLIGIQKTINGHGQKEFQAQADILQPIDVVGSILMDIPFYSHWIGNCKRIVLLEGMNAMAGIAFFEMDMPWPISDREVIFRIKTTVDPKQKRIHIHGEALKNHPYPVSESNIRITDAEFNITLANLEPYKTRMTVTNRFYFGKIINQSPSLSNLLAGASLSSSMTNFKELSKFSRYNRILLCRDEFKQVLQNKNPVVDCSPNYISAIR